MTTLHATLDPFVGTLTTTNMAFALLLNDFEFSRQCLHKNTKYGFQKMDQIASSWILILWLSRASEGRWKRISSPQAKKGSPEQKSRCRIWAEACHSPFNHYIKSEGPNLVPWETPEGTDPHSDAQPTRSLTFLRSIKEKVNYPIDYTYRQVRNLNLLTKMLWSVKPKAFL